MKRIRLQTEISLEEFLNKIEQLDTSDLQEMLTHLLREQARRKAISLSKQEADLIRAINQSLSPEAQGRFRVLQQKRQAETLSSIEQRELTELTETLEALAVARTERLIELAALRGQSLEQVQAELNLGAQYE